MAEQPINDMAKATLRALSEIAASARESLRVRGDPTNALVTPNELSVDRITRISLKQSTDNARIAKEPALARVLTEDEFGKQTVYYICRVSPPAFQSSNFSLVSYRAPMGKMATLPVGKEHHINSPRGFKKIRIVEKAEFVPVLFREHWDARNSNVWTKDRLKLVIRSFRAMLEGSEKPMSNLAVSKVPIDEMVLGESLQTGVQAEGSCNGDAREIRSKMELRDKPILDQFQDEIFRLPLDSKIYLMGAPGTGKTTTLIRRLGQKLDLTALSKNRTQFNCWFSRIRSLTFMGTVYTLRPSERVYERGILSRRNTSTRQKRYDLE